MIGPLYLLGFPTPVIELFLGGIILFLATAIYFGLSFTGLDEVDIDQDRAGHDGDSSTRMEEPEA